MDDFLEQLEKFINNLMAAMSNMDGQITLEENGVGHIIDAMESPADYQAVGRCTMMIPRVSYFVAHFFAGICTRH